MFRYFNFYHPVLIDVSVSKHVEDDEVAITFENVL